MSALQQKNQPALQQVKNRIWSQVYYTAHYKVYEHVGKVWQPTVKVVMDQVLSQVWGKLMRGPL